MKTKGAIQKIVAAIFLLLFLQKSGIELYIHNWLHVKNHVQASSSSRSIVSACCSCVDDALMPFAEQSDEISSSLSIPHQIFALGLIEPVLSVSEYFTALRAPPVFPS